MVVTYNSEHLLEDFVSSLHDGMRGASWSLTVADNASSDGSAELLRSIAPQATVIEMNRNRGYAAGINAAVAASPPHSAILVMNPDVRLGEASVAVLLEALQEPNVGIAVPKLYDGHGAIIMSLRREPTVLRAFGDAFVGAERVTRWPTLSELVGNHGEYEEPRTVDWAEGAIQLISSTCWDQSGPWNESFFLYSEETEFDLRAKDRGYLTRFQPKAEATHLRGQSRTSSQLWALLIHNKVKLYRMRNGRAGTVGFWVAMVLRELTRGLLGKQPSWNALRVLVWPAHSRRIVDLLSASPSKRLRDNDS